MAESTQVPLFNDKGGLKKQGEEIGDQILDSILRNSVPHTQQELNAKSAHEVVGESGHSEVSGPHLGFETNGT